MNEYVLEVKNIHKTYKVRVGLKGKEIEVLKGLSFNLKPGVSLGIVGESGSGKSTLVKIIAGLEAPTQGQLFWEGQPLSYPRKPNPKHIQMVFQDPYASLNPKQKIKSILEEPLKLNTSLSASQRLEKIVFWLQAFNLSPEILNRYPHQFSGGQRQRIALARAFLLEPKLVILDEPVSALDVSVQAQILTLLKKIHLEQKRNYIFISHDLAVVRYLCSEMLVMWKGEIVEQGKTKEILANPTHAYTQSLLEASLG